MSEHDWTGTDNGAFPNPWHYTWCRRCHKKWTLFREWWGVCRV